jgi:hypothetical protein
VIEQRLVPIGQFDQVNIAVKVGQLGIELLLDALRLPLHCFDGGRQQALKPVLAAFLDRERGSVSSDMIRSAVLSHERRALISSRTRSFCRTPQAVRMESNRARSFPEAWRV